MTSTLVAFLLPILITPTWLRLRFFLRCAPFRLNDVGVPGAAGAGIHTTFILPAIAPDAGSAQSAAIATVVSPSRPNQPWLARILSIPSIGFPAPALPRPHTPSPRHTVAVFSGY